MRGRVYRNPGTPVVVAPVAVKFISKGYPSRIHPTLPIRGRTYSNKGAPVKNPTRGPRFVQAVHPVRGIIPKNAPRGRTYGNQGGPVANIPVRQGEFFPGDLFTNWLTGNPFVNWNLGDVFVLWETGAPFTNWSTGDVFIAEGPGFAVYDSTYHATY
jgi:hypothetical protein